MWMVLTTECAYDNDMICQMIARLVGSKLREQQNYLRKRPSAQLVSDAPNGMRPAVLSHIVTLLLGTNELLDYLEGQAGDGLAPADPSRLLLTEQFDQVPGIMLMSSMSCFVLTEIYVYRYHSYPKNPV